MILSGKYWFIYDYILLYINCFENQKKKKIKKLSKCLELYIILFLNILIFNKWKTYYK